jgi:hypothetical protein
MGTVPLFSADAVVQRTASDSIRRLIPLNSTTRVFSWTEHASHDTNRMSDVE